MNLLRCSLFLTMVASMLVATPRAQDVRELSVPTAHQVQLNVTVSTINGLAFSGYRVVDLEYRSGSGSSSRFDVSLVRNTGSYTATWWWYYGASVSQIQGYLATNNARLIDLESYVDSAGQQRFACVMVDNTGANQKSWWWYVNTTPTALGQAAANNNARLIDVDSYRVNNTTYHLGVMIANTGADARAWWWYLDRTSAQVSSLLNSNNARLYDLGRNASGNWDVIMIQDPTPTAWHWWTNATANDVAFLMNNYGVRVIDVESYLVGFVRRFSIVTINNVNELSTNVGQAMRARTDGAVGCWLQRVNGPQLAGLNEATPFEPASTMKTLHHAHAMRRVSIGATPLNQGLTVFTNYSPTEPSCPIDSGPTFEALQTALRLMMENSDNARTQAIATFFGQSSINATAAALGMTDTSLNHRLGCNAPAVANPNRTTLRDLHELHEQVANGYLGAYRDTFYDLMLDNVNDLGVAALIQSEANQLGLSNATTQSFLAFTRLAHKGGSYGLSNGGPLFHHRAEFGWLSLPAIHNGSVIAREFTFGAFVNDASNGADASAAIYTDALPLLLRPQIHDALQTWTNHLAGVVNVGTGCGSPLHLQTVNGLPRLGTTPNYIAVQGFPNALGAFTMGLSETAWNGIPLPASLAPIGGEPGCQVWNDVVTADFFVSNSAGGRSVPFPIPNDTNLLGFEYLSQFWSFGPSSLRSSNGLRSMVGF
ncbi:MAG: serine hydrolase [Planctomycetes bacterium]|nr:serine hydrolase [Planctomycetota bacterium]